MTPLWMQFSNLCWVQKNSRKKNITKIMVNWKVMIKLATLKCEIQIVRPPMKTTTQMMHTRTSLKVNKTFDFMNIYKHISD